jgi:hypothetical protein
VRFIDHYFAEPAIGRAYRARVKHDRVDVVFRYVFPEITLDQHYDSKIIEDTEKEALLLCGLRHASIISIIGTTGLQEGPALLFEPTFCSVASALEKGPKSKSFAVRVAAQIASAVEYLHRRSICNGAIDAYNVVLLHGFEKDPFAKLSNFSHSARMTRRSQGKDIESLEIFIGLLFRGEADTALDDPEDAVVLEALQNHHAKIAPIIQGGPRLEELSATEIAFELSRLDQMVESNADGVAESNSARLAAWLQSAKGTKWSV